VWPILLVAIVILAGVAIFYVRTASPPVSGCTAGACPLATWFGWGPASNVTSGTRPYPGCEARVECYALDIGVVQGGPTGNDVSFTARASTGAELSIAGWKFTLVTTTNVIANALWVGDATCAGTSCSATLETGEVVALSTGATASLLGDNVVAVWHGPYQGEISTVGGLPA
jgi:hypothetical protein